ncbi:hypothetical protein ABFS82_11G059700 [Erythranthe guttata]
MQEILSSKNNSTSGFLDLLLGDLGDELRLHDQRLVLRQESLAQNLEVSELGDVDHRRVVLCRLVPDILWNHRPELLDVDNGAVELVSELVEVAHTDLPEVSGMVLVEEDAVVVHASGVSSASGMLAVLSDTAVSGADVASLLPVLPQAGRHCCLLCVCVDRRRNGGDERWRNGTRVFVFEAEDLGIGWVEMELRI